MAVEIARKAERFGPDLILAIGGFHTPIKVVSALRELRIAAPIVGWVGDAFRAEVAPLADLYDLVAHTDSGLQARHRDMGFSSPTLWLPHAANPHRVGPHRAGPRRDRTSEMVFVAAASPERQAAVAEIALPISIYGPGWRDNPPARHCVVGDRVPHRRLAGIYAGYAASLNIRNADNVLDGLNQRNFDPYLFGAAVIGDAQPDLARCFEPGAETLVFNSPAELDDHHARLKREPAWIAKIAARGLDRIHAEHMFAHRLAAIVAVTG